MIPGGAGGAVIHMAAVFAVPAAAGDIHTAAGKAAEFHRDVVIVNRHAVDQTAVYIHALVAAVQTGGGFTRVSLRVEIVAVKTDAVEFIGVLETGCAVNGNP